jgi:putative nucleotidyltransferase with HDIG domain
MATAQRGELLDYRGLHNLDLLLQDVSKLVSLPDVYYRLESLIELPSSSMSDFAKLLSSEPDLCARLLSLANSAFYSFPASIESIDKAVQIIGIRQIRELVLATTIAKSFSQVPLGMVNMQLFWEHSVAVGVLAKSIAQYCKLSQVERFYVGGLLHDIGRLVFYMKLPGVMNDLLIQREAKEEILYKLEKDALGYTHAEAGGRLLRNWRVPDSIYEPVMCHHQLDESSDYLQVTAAIHIADAWVNNHHKGSSGEHFELTINPLATEALSIQIYELDEIWELAKDDINSVVKQFLLQ